MDFVQNAIQNANEPLLRRIKELEDENKKKKNRIENLERDNRILMDAHKDSRTVDPFINLNLPLNPDNTL